MLLMQEFALSVLALLSNAFYPSLPLKLVDRYVYFNVSPHTAAECCCIGCWCSQAYSPLAKAQKLSDKRVVALADKHGKTPAQVTL